MRAPLQHTVPALPRPAATSSSRATLLTLHILRQAWVDTIPASGYCSTASNSYYVRTVARLPVAVWSHGRVSHAHSESASLQHCLGGKLDGPMQQAYGSH